jgi:hypothetical protein
VRHLGTPAETSSLPHRRPRRARGRVVGHRVRRPRQHAPVRVQVERPRASTPASTGWSGRGPRQHDALQPVS